MLTRKFMTSPFTAILGFAILMLAVAPSWAHTDEELQEELRIKRETRDGAAIPMPGGSQVWWHTDEELQEELRVRRETRDGHGE